MHSTLVRAQNVFGFFTTVCFCVAALVAVSSFLVPTAPKADLKLRNVQVVKGRPHYYSTKKEEYAHVKFDLDADMSSLFTWNTKQVFLYIVARYPSSNPKNPPSEAVIWDAIIPSVSAPWHHNQYIHPVTAGNPRPHNNRDTKPYRSSANGTNPGYVHLKNQRPKYVISDITGKIAERDGVVLELHWNVQPWVGALTWANWGNWGRWSQLQGGKSEAFSFPALKTAKEVKESKGDLDTVKGGEGNRGKPA